MNELTGDIFIVGALQGFLFTILLVIRKQNYEANRVLAFAVFCLSIDLVSTYLRGIKYYEKYPQTFFISLAFSLLYGPLFYLYTLLLTKRTKKIELKFILHLIPFILIRAYFLPFYFLSHQEKFSEIGRLLHSGDFVLSLYGFFVPVSGLIYTFLSLRVIKQFNETLKISFSNLDKIKVEWLKYVTISGLVVWLVVATYVVINIVAGGRTNSNTAIHLVISIFVYTLGGGALFQPEIFANSELLLVQENSNKTVQKYRKSTLTETDIERIKESIISLIEQKKLYLNADLNISQISGELKITNHNISEVLSKAFNKNFYDFINSYRVEEFKERIKNPEYLNYSLLAVAMDSGFNSKSSFNMIFKKHTNTTPSEYRRQVLELINHQQFV